MKRMDKKRKVVLLIMLVSVMLFSGCSDNTGNESGTDKKVVNTQINNNKNKDQQQNGTGNDNAEPNATKPEGNSNAADDSSSTPDSEIADKNDKNDKVDNNDKNDKETKELSIYTINDDTLETEPIIEEIPKDTEITPQVVVDEVINAFADNSYEVKVQNVAQEGDAIIVNFSKDSAPVVNVGASVECTTLECISYSLLDNIPECKKVIFRIDGEAYVTGHIEKGINEPYTTGN